MATASARMPSARRGPGRVTTTSSMGRTIAVLDRGQRVPAGARGHLLGGHAVGRIAEEDHLRVEGQDLLGPDLVDAVRAAGERIATGDLDHLGPEVVGRRAEVAGRRVQLVVGAGGVLARRRRGHVVEGLPDGRVHRGRLVGPAHRPADQLDVLLGAGDVGREDDQDRDAEVAQLFDRLGGVEVVAAGDHEVRAQGDDLLDVHRAELGDVGDGGGGLRVGGEVLHLADDAVAHAEREERLGRGGGQGHDLRGLGRDGGGAVLVVGQLDGKQGCLGRGALVGTGVGATVAGAVVGAGVAGDGVRLAAGADEQAASTTASRRPATARKGREGRASTGTPTRVRTTGDPWLRGTKQGSGGGSHGYA